MATEVLLPKMGESVAEATITTWVKNVGDTIEEEESLVEIATDKVDSEVPSPATGIVKEIFFQEGEVAQVGAVIAIIDTGDGSVEPVKTENTPSNLAIPAIEKVAAKIESGTAKIQNDVSTVVSDYSNTNRFYSPLVKNIASKEGISLSELEKIVGSGKEGRVTKKDILNYIDNRESDNSSNEVRAETIANTTSAPVNKPVEVQTAKAQTPSVNYEGKNVEIIEMDRMRTLISEHMVRSKHTSPHVTSFVEADVTELVNWRNSIKNSFAEKEGEKITFTPIFVEAIVKALKDFPMVNISIDGNKIIKKNYINIGIAAALPSGNLIVPVIKNADYLNLTGLVKSTNDLVKRARINKLKPDEIQDGTFTLTNVGTFGNLMGTPIINQPQAAILAVGSIKKKPAVIETPQGDHIAIRQMMYLSLSYDHRAVDGALGGAFLRKVADYLEQFDSSRTI